MPWVSVLFAVYIAGAPASARPARASIARPNAAQQRTGIPPPTTGQSLLPTVMQNGCENAEANDAPPPPQKAHAGGMTVLCIMFII